MENCLGNVLHNEVPPSPALDPPDVSSFTVPVSERAFYKVSHYITVFIWGLGTFS